MEHFNSPDKLPPTETPLIVLIAGMKFKAERVSIIKNKSDLMEYKLSNGSTILDRFEWTYP